MYVCVATAVCCQAPLRVEGAVWREELAGLYTAVWRLSVAPTCNSVTWRLCHSNLQAKVVSSAQLVRRPPCPHQQGCHPVCLCLSLTICVCYTKHVFVPQLQHIGVPLLITRAVAAECWGNPCAASTVCLTHTIVGMCHRLLAHACRPAAFLACVPAAAPSSLTCRLLPVPCRQSFCSQWNVSLVFAICRCC